MLIRLIIQQYVGEIMKAIIFHSQSSDLRSKKIAESFDGTIFEIKSLEKKMSKFCTMFIYGFKTVFSKKVKFLKPEIDFSLYDEIVIVSPVWAGRVNIFVSSYLKEVNIENKRITLVGSCDGGYKNYFESFNNVLSDTNEVVERIIYVKGIRL